jgi:CRP-like cAMP-binding protein
MSPTINNKLLRSLPEKSLERIVSALELVELRSGQTIDHVDGPIESLYFINSGIVSLVKIMRDGRAVEVSAVGIEGVTDSHALFGINPAVVESMVQVPGNAFKASREFLRLQMLEDPALANIMQRYARYAFGQLAQTAACNRLHTLEERCCRWILTSHDSAMNNTFPLTHEFLGMMLGAPRSSVSLVAKILQRAGCIEYRRGKLTIRDRRGIEDGSCECYFDNIAELKRTLGSIPPMPAPDFRPDA